MEFVRDVDGQSYQFSKWGAKQSLKTLVRLSRIVGKSVTVAFGTASADKGFLDRKFDAEVLGKAVGALVENLEEDEVLTLCEDLASRGVLCDGKQIIFDRHYEQRLDHLFRVIRAALEVQYGNFFSVLSGLKGGIVNSTTTQAPRT